MTPAHRVLIVDDDLMIRGLLGTVLGRYGVLCEFAEDGHEAIARLAAGGYSAILLDLMMPRVDGFGVIEHLRETGNRTPVLVVTAAGAARTRLLDPHVVKAVLLKPFEILQLVDSVVALCTAFDRKGPVRDATLRAGI